MRRHRSFATQFCVDGYSRKAPIMVVFCGWRHLTPPIWRRHQRFPPTTFLLSSSSSSSHFPTYHSTNHNHNHNQATATATATTKRNASTTTAPVDGIPIGMFNVTATSTDDIVIDNEDDVDTTLSSTPSNATATATATAVLSWDKFEYSASPKIDTRFGKVQYNHTNSTELPKEELLERLHEQETKFDQQHSQLVRTQQQLWNSLSADTVQVATHLLQQYIQPERIQRIQTVLQHRTQHVRFLFENPSNPSNVYACLRTIDAFGIQNVDIITQSNQYRGKAAIYQKRNMRTAMGSAKWLTITNYVSTEEAIRAIRNQHHCRIYASDVNPDAIDIRTIDWSNNNPSRPLRDTNGENHSNGDTTNYQESDDPPICIVMGNEDSGISDTMRQLVDVTFTLSMVGFAESFNLSVATAIVLAQLSAMSLPPPPPSTNDDGDVDDVNRAVIESTETGVTRGKERRGLGPIRPGDLSKEEYNRLYLKALINSLPQKRMARGMLKTVGITLPKELNL